MIRIAITGPESSGKTTLTQALSEELNGTPFLEFARAYLERLDRNYVQSDLNNICEGHLNQFRESEDEFQLVDTDFIVLKIWSHLSFGSVSEEIQSAIASDYFDLHILCTPDIPWQYDPLREHPNQRDKLFEMYKKELFAASKLFIIVSGSLEERIKKSCEAIASIQR